MHRLKNSFPNFAASYNSLINWTMSDCALSGGKVVLGAPIKFWNFRGRGTVVWENNLFDRVLVSLMPSLMADEVLIDQGFEARNNLFRGKGWFAVQARTTNAPPWVFTDNLFEQTEFWQDPDWPFQADHNAYRPLTKPYWSDDTWHLLDGNTSTGGAGDVALTHDLAYTNGPLGNFYLTQFTPLWQAGSRTASEAGLTEYTTFANQWKDTSNQPVNIGLHYVAATNSYLLTSNFSPLDSDSDGVPDYVEVEHGTNPHDAMTDGTTPDALNPAYDDVDLSGNGLVGRIKKALNLPPLCPTNPLVLKQIITGEEPDIATFEVPVSYDVLTNVGGLNLKLNGGNSAWEEYTKVTNGNCLLRWNTTLDPPGQYFIQAKLTINGAMRNGYSPGGAISFATGILSPFSSSNVFQFNNFYSSFSDGGAVLHATMRANESTNYTIELQTSSGQHLKTITNNTSDGVIFENWDLTDDSGNTFTGDSFKAVFNLTPPSAAQASYPFNFPSALNFYRSPDSVPDGNFTIAYAEDALGSAVAGSAKYNCIQHGVVDSVLTPSPIILFNNFYHSIFNDFTSPSSLNGNPGHLTTAEKLAALIENLTNSLTRNFHFDGHGSETEIGDSEAGSAVSIKVNVLSRALGNYNSTAQGNHRDHPYRFVFLNACDTSNDDGWHNAFGIPGKIKSEDLILRPDKVQAFVGWDNSLRCPFWPGEWDDLAETYTIFYSRWMVGGTLDDCINSASKTYPFNGDYSVRLDWPFGTQFPINGLAGMMGSFNNFHIKVYGYTGITRNGFQPGHDNSINYWK